MDYHHFPSEATPQVIAGLISELFDINYDDQGAIANCWGDLKEKDADTTLLEKELSLKLGLKFSINDKNNKGNIKIEYRNIEQREKIINKLKRD